VVHQTDKQGTGERADYTAADEKFVLSGGAPTVTDEDNNTTTGRSLTFYRASDTIFIDSEHGSRTLTKHQVEK
jgi:lipopolysaccharide export system protein LptA